MVLRRRDQRDVTRLSRPLIVSDGVPRRTGRHQNELSRPTRSHSAVHHAIVAFRGDRQTDCRQLPATLNLSHPIPPVERKVLLVSRNVLAH